MSVNSLIEVLGQIFQKPESFTEIVLSDTRYPAHRPEVVADIPNAGLVLLSADACAYVGAERTPAVSFSLSPDEFERLVDAMPDLGHIQGIPKGEVHIIPEWPNGKSSEFVLSKTALSAMEKYLSQHNPSKPRPTQKARGQALES